MLYRTPVNVVQINMVKTWAWSGDQYRTFTNAMTILGSVILGFHSLNQRFGVFAGGEYQNVSTKTTAHQTRTQHRRIRSNNVDKLFNVVITYVVKVS